MLIHFLQRSTNLTKRPVSFCITGALVHLEISTRIERLINSVSSQCARDKASTAQKPQVHPNGKNKIKILKNVTLQIPNLILPTRMLNIFPIKCNVNFETVISALNNTKRTDNVTLNDIGNILLVNLPRQNLKSGGLNLYKMCLTIKNFGMALRLLRNKQFSTRTQR